MSELGLSQVSSAPESPLKTNSEHELHLERQAVRKLDYTLIPVVTIFYLVTFLACSLWNLLRPFLIILQDRSNIGEKYSVSMRYKGLKFDYRKCSSCRPPKGSPFDRHAIRNLCYRIFYVRHTSKNILHIVHNSQQQSRPYIIGELPCSLLLRKIGPKFLMPTLVTIWGVVTASQGQ